MTPGAKFLDENPVSHKMINGERITHRFVFLDTVPCDDDLFLLEELDEEEFSLDWFLCFLLDFFFAVEYWEMVGMKLSYN